MAATTTEDQVTTRLSVLNRYLPVWIGTAMASGLLLGRWVPDLDEGLDAIRVGTVSLPIAIGLLTMMYPVLAKVRYRRIGSEVTRDGAVAVTLVFNWLVGPLLMTGLAWLFLSGLPELRTGLVIVGIAPCIAMVLIWNDLAFGNRELAAALVAINSLIQIAVFSAYGWFLLTVLPRWFGLETQALDVSVWEIARSVLVFLGIPLLLGFLTRTVGESRMGTEWYEERFLPRIGPVALYGLLFTIVVLFALQGQKITTSPLDVVRVAFPLTIFFGVMWFSAFLTGRRLGFPYDRTASLAFTAAGNNFELAIAVSIAVFGVTSGQALAGTIGPLIEVPVLVALVYVSLRLRRFWSPETHPDPRVTPGTGGSPTQHP